MRSGTWANGDSAGRKVVHDRREAERVDVDFNSKRKGRNWEGERRKEGEELRERRLDTKREQWT